MDSFDLVVIGGGTGGYATALRAAQLGRSVALVERGDRLGGTCLLRGCIPTKALLRSAEVLDEVRASSAWGITASGTPDREGIVAFKQGIVDKLVAGLSHLIQTRRVEVVTGTGILVEGPAVEVDGRRLEAADVVLATGSRPKVLPGIEEGPRVMTSARALELETIPGSVVVIGAGAIGLEFASFYRSMGADVTVLEALPRIAPLEDEEISKWLARSFKKRGITTRAGASVSSVLDQGDHVEVEWRTEAGEGSAEADLCLVAVGRGPVSDGLGEAGVALERGAIVVDEELRTNIPQVWAVGDVASTPLQFAHVAFAEGISVAERTAGLDVAPISYQGVPRVTFSTPEVASVGLTEAQAIEDHGEAVGVSRFDMRGLGKANIVGEGGLVKLVAADGHVVGAHLIGPHATDLISEPMLMTNLGLPVDDLARLIHPHPTLGEGIGEALLGLAGKPLHAL
jgi:dihydrolipoamide dehydrogenase